MDSLIEAMARKCEANEWTTFKKAIFGGMYIALGGVFMCALKAQGMPPLVCGLAFSMGLLAVVATGVELLTGDALMAVAVKSGNVGASTMFRKWAVVMAGNLAGSLVVVMLADATGCTDAVSIAEAKAAIPPDQLFWRGVACNILVCLAVWLASGGATVTDKAVAVLWYVAAFVACGFEHSIADMFLMPLGMMGGADVSMVQCATTISVVMLGNMAGGFAFACALYAVEEG